MTSLRVSLFGLSFLSLAALAFAGQGCGGDDPGSEFDAGGSSGGGGDGNIDIPNIGSDGSAEAAAKCRGLECDRVTCSGSETTSIEGTVFEPLGTIPLYNVIVYIPNSPLPAIANGATCDKCGSVLLNPVASDLTKSDGSFKLTNVPVPKDGMIPLVMQVGKWRREVSVKVEACKKNTYNKKDANNQEEVLRLPRKQSEGSLPQIAVSTGSADPLVCLLPRLGIDATEFTAPTGTGRVHIYQGVGGGNIAGVSGNESQATLWDSAPHLAKYDMLLLSCEGKEYNQTKSDAQKTLLRDYLNVGGRAFATHYHYTWFKNGAADLKTVATWGTVDGAKDPPETFAANVDPGFPKGVAFGQWLKNVGASPNGVDLSLASVATSITSINPVTSQEWVFNDGRASDAIYRPKYMSFNAPVGAKAEDQCGKAVLSDIHISAGTQQDNIPSSCGNTPLTAQEKALLFLFMDLSSCVQNDKEPPVIPK
jgi:hypothetical protein